MMGALLGNIGGIVGGGAQAANTLTTGSSYSQYANRLSEIASQQAQTAIANGQYESAAGFQAAAKQWQAYGGMGIQTNAQAFGVAPQILNTPQELAYLNSYGAVNPFAGLYGGGGGGYVPQQTDTPQSTPQMYGPLPPVFSPYGQAAGGSAWLGSQPWGQQGIPGLAADTGGTATTQPPAIGTSELSSPGLVAMQGQYDPAGWAPSTTFGTAPNPVSSMFNQMWGYNFPASPVGGD